MKLWMVAAVTNLIGMALALYLAQPQWLVIHSAMLALIGYLGQRKIS